MVGNRKNEVTDAAKHRRHSHARQLEIMVLLKTPIINEMSFFG